MHVPTKSNDGGSLGFLTAVDFDGAVVGGYLVLNLTGRPLEFHCTAPVKPTRAQEILYGPTLRPFLLGEQIGGTLLGKSKAKASLIVTDQQDMLSARGVCDTPLACIDLSEHVTANQDAIIIDQRTLTVARGYPGDRDAFQDRWQKFGVDLDLAEPFSRIHEAIAEAQKSRTKAA